MNTKQFLAALGLLLCGMVVDAGAKAPIYPTGLVVDGDVRMVTSRTQNSLLVYKGEELVATTEFDRAATGVVTIGDDIYVTTSYDKGFLHKLSSKDYSVVKTIETGMGAKAPLVSEDKKYIYVCNQFAGDVVKVDVAKMEIVGRVKVSREPFDAALSADGKKLYVNNFLPSIASNLDYVGSYVSVIDVETMTLLKNELLSNGSNALRGITTTPDGRYVLVSHNLGRFQVPTSQLQQGWMNTSAMSVIDAKTDEMIGSVLLDTPDRGYAGIWGIEANEEKIFVSHSGVHAITVIDYAKFVEKLEGYKNYENLSIDLNFLYGITERIKVAGNGPRGMYLTDDNLYAVSYFSDDLNIVNTKSNAFSSVSLNPERVEDSIDRGERVFNDAKFCFQEWQSCNGCHPGDGRTDGMNWDLMNDGIGNAKNCKSMLFSHITPPSMISGIRASAELAVRKGFTHIQFSQIDEPSAVDVDEYLKALEPLPSPYLVDGELSELAVEGRKVFEAQRCDDCHSGPLFTDKKMYVIGDDVEFEKGWDTPTLREVWRTGPYLFDGRAVTMEEVFAVYGHGINKKLKKHDLSALVEYVNSL